jgi:hypothetical protein
MNSTRLDSPSCRASSTRVSTVDELSRQMEKIRKVNWGRAESAAVGRMIGVQGSFLDFWGARGSEARQTPPPLCRNPQPKPYHARPLCQQSPKTNRSRPNLAKRDNFPVLGDPHTFSFDWLHRIRPSAPLPNRVSAGMDLRNWKNLPAIGCRGPEYAVRRAEQRTTDPSDVAQ